jgi:hypothetical protein
MTIATGNKKVFPSPPPPNSSESRESSIVSRTQRQAFGESPAINNPAATYGGGTRNSLGGMEDLSGKTLQESYRSGLSRSADATDGVEDR